MKFEVTFMTKAGNKVVGTFEMYDRDQLIRFIGEQDLLFIDQGINGEYVIAPENIDMLIIKVVK